jgi:hypothetical protein
MKGDEVRLWRVVLKAGALFALFNILYVALNPLESLTRLSLYNVLWRGRERLPYSEDPSADYSLSEDRLAVAFASHILSRPKTKGEYRVFWLGDSSVWGWGLAPDETFTACLNQNQESQRRAYNLGYPTLSAFKDLLILDHSLAHQPDMLIWTVTLAALYPSEQTRFPFVHVNQAAARRLIQDDNLRPVYAEALPPMPTLWGRSFIAQRADWNRWLGGQVYGLAWSGTGLDHRNPDFSRVVQRELREGETLLDGSGPQNWSQADLSFDVLKAGLKRARAAGVPLWIVNAPIYISTGLNSAQRYNFEYPRWAYDRYRFLLAEWAEENQVPWLDLWDFAPPEAFTDSSFHLTPTWTCRVAERVAQTLWGGE